VQRARWGVTAAVALVMVGAVAHAWTGRPRADVEAQARDAATAPVPTGSSRQAAALLEQYCVTCHNDRLKTAGLSLEHADPAGAAATPSSGRRCCTRSGPGRCRRPDGRSRHPSRMPWPPCPLATALDEHAARPRSGPRRASPLNRTEYANAVRDMLGLTVDAKALLLPDEADEGFDNVAASLALSPRISSATSRRRGRSAGSPLAT
jgi:hypothetical protein